MRLLGRVEVATDGRALPLAAHRARAPLALLALYAGGRRAAALAAYAEARALLA